MYSGEAAQGGEAGESLVAKRAGDAEVPAEAPSMVYALSFLRNVSLPVSIVVTAGAWGIVLTLDPGYLHNGHLLFFVMAHGVNAVVMMAVRREG